MSNNTLPLQNKWVVVTRPKHQAENLRQLLESSGANVILFPLLEISPSDNIEKAKQQLSEITNTDLAIFISPNAVDECFKWIAPSSLQDISVASVGAKTTEKLNEHGIQADISPESVFNSESLLSLPEIQKLNKDCKVTILRGEEGRDLLKHKLQDQGCEVNYIELYKRTCPQNSLSELRELANNDQLDIMLITSGTSIKNLYALQETKEDENWLNQMSLIVGSERIKRQVLSSTSHAGELLSTINPSDENLYEEVLEWSKQS